MNKFSARRFHKMTFLQKRDSWPTLVLSHEVNIPILQDSPALQSSPSLAVAWSRRTNNKALKGGLTDPNVEISPLWRYLTSQRAVLALTNLWNHLTIAQLPPRRSQKTKKQYNWSNVEKKSAAFTALFQNIPGDKGLLSLSLRIVSLLVVVIIVFEAALLPSPVPLLGPVVVVALPRPGPRAGPGAAPVGTSYAKTSKVSRLSETTLSIFTFPLPVSWCGKFWPKTVRGQAPVAAVFTVAATGTTTRSPETRTARISVITRTRTIRRWHFWWNSK